MMRARGYGVHPFDGGLSGCMSVMHPPEHCTCNSSPADGFEKAYLLKSYYLATLKSVIFIPVFRQLAVSYRQFVDVI